MGEFGKGQRNSLGDGIVPYLFRWQLQRCAHIVKLHQTEHVNYTSIKIWCKSEPIMRLKKEKEKRKRNPLLYQRPLANKCRDIKEAESQYSFPIRLEREVTEESILTGAKGICRQLAKSREKRILSLCFQLLNPTLLPP